MHADGFHRTLILGEFPVQALPGKGVDGTFPGSTCTWLLALARAWEHQVERDLHWGVLLKGLKQKVVIKSWGQTFHLLPTSERFRAKGFYRADRKVLTRLIGEIQPEVVHGWGSEDIYGWTAALSGKPHLVSVQGILGNYIRQAAMFHPKVYLLALLERLLFRRAQLLTVESRWGEGQIRRVAPCADIRVIEYGIQKIFFETPWSPQAPAAAIFVGTIDPNKGIEDLVEAFRSSELLGHELWVVGGGGRFAEKLRAKSTKNVRWLGRLSPEETARTMARASCLALPSRNETSPNVVKEARVIGIPVLTTLHGGQSAYLIDQEDGFLIKPGEVRQTREALIRILKNPVLAKNFGDVGQQRYREYFRSEKTAACFLSLYNELAGKTVKSRK